jgi:hypothetical protein
MTDSIHASAPHNLPFYLPGADGSDPLLTTVIFVLLAVLMAAGVLYFKIHSLPEHLAERHNNTQVQLIMALTLLALFTHNNTFWVLALLLAVVRFPDFLTPLHSIADSLKKLVPDETEDDVVAVTPVTPAPQAGPSTGEEK